jgi:tRNA-guanine family transglycosylase
VFSLAYGSVHKELSSKGELKRASRGGGCQHYDRVYTWHLFKANESLAVTLAAQHNIHYMNDLMKDIRQDIMDDKI